MNPIELLSSRRSIREFTTREVTRAEIETLLEHAVTVPNHRLTQPWKFFVLGPVARRAFGLALGARKARKLEDPTAAAQLRQKVAEEHAALPLIIAVAIVQHENPEIREEDYAAGMMAVQNISLAAVAPRGSQRGIALAPELSERINRMRRCSRRYLSSFVCFNDP